MDNRMKRYLSLFTGAVLAGLAIGIGGTVFLSIADSTAGALMFTVGLFIICVHGLNLYTGKVGYLTEHGPDYLAELAVIWAGNFAGTWLTGEAVQASRIRGIAERAQAMCTVKLQDSCLSLFLLAIFCGLLMYAAVEGYRQTKQPLLLFACVAGFILCGFEHCIADMFYFSAARLWGGSAFLRILVITAGNSVGGILIPLGKKLRD